MSLWGSNRPALLGWWLNDSVDGSSLVGDGQSVAEPLRRAAQHRGLPLRLPLVQIAAGAVLAWPTLGLHVALEPELFLFLFLPPLLFSDGWRMPTTVNSTSPTARVRIGPRRRQNSRLGMRQVLGLLIGIGRHQRDTEHHIGLIEGG